MFNLLFKMLKGCLALYLVNENIVHLNSVSAKAIVQCCLNKPVFAFKVDLIFIYVVPVCSDFNTRLA